MQDLSPESRDELHKFANAAKETIIPEEAWVEIGDLAAELKRKRESETKSRYVELEEGFDNVQKTIEDYEMDGWELVDQYVTIGEGIETATIHLFFKKTEYGGND